MDRTTWKKLSAVSQATYLLPGATIYSSAAAEIKLIDETVKWGPIPLSKVLENAIIHFVSFIHVILQAYYNVHLPVQCIVEICSGRIISPKLSIVSL